MTSHHPKDLEEGYCGYCNWWTSDPMLGLMMLDGEHLPKCSRSQCIGCRVDTTRTLPS